MFSKRVSKGLLAAVIAAALIFTAAANISAAQDLSYIGVCNLMNRELGSQLENTGNVPIISQYNGSAQQYWKFYQKSNGNYEIIPAADPSKRLTVKNKAAVIDTAKNNDASQEWNLTAANVLGGSYDFFISNPASKLLLASTKPSQPGGQAVLVSTPASVTDADKEMIWTQAYIPQSQATAPTASPKAGAVDSGQKITLASSDNADIYYTLDGSDPATSASTRRYTASVAITITKSTTVNAVAMNAGYATGYADSPVASFTYTVSATPAAAPSPNIRTGSTVAKGTPLVLASATKNAVIYYTDDGTAPTSSSKKFGSSIPINADVTIKAIASASGYANSAVSAMTYKVQDSDAEAAAPVADTASGTVAAGTSITLTCSTSGSTVYYTDDGTAPTSSGKRYSQPIKINATMTIKAIASAPNFSDSEMSVWTYTIQGEQPAVPVVPSSREIKLTIGQLPYTMNGEEAQFDVAPYIEPSGGRTMVPIRFIARGLGANVEWDGESQTDTITLNSATLSITINKALPDSMGTPMIVNDRLFVPIRYISEQLGAKVEWDGAAQTVTINQQ